MNKYRHALGAALLTLFAFVAVTYTSCTKDPCEAYSCQNNGTCSGGNCVCPSQYTGVHCEQLATTTLAFKNNSRSTITIQMTGSSNKSVPPGSSVNFSGNAGQTMTAFASLNSYLLNGISVGSSFGWSFVVTFPTSGTAIQNIDVPSNYFFLQVINTSTYNISYGEVGSTYVNATVPNNGQTYGLGYYYVSGTSSAVFYSGTGKTWNFNNLSFPNMVDQVVTLTAN